MTKVVLLEQLKLFTEEAVKDLLLPVSVQKGDAEPPKLRAAEVYQMRLPDSSAAKKKAPYIIHQVITGKDNYGPWPGATQVSGRYNRIPLAVATIRSIFCIYNSDGQEGALSLLNLMERFRIAILKQGVIGEQFRLDLHTGMESLVYPENDAPYYAGEILSNWILPAMKREVEHGKEGNSNTHPTDPGRPACGKSDTGYCGFYDP